MEEWRKIPGLPAWYEASNLGRIRTLDRPRRHWRGAEHLHNWTGRVMSFAGQSAEKHPYFTFRWCLVGRVTTMTVHRAIALAFIANPDGKRTVNHIDGNKRNNIVTNLEWATSRENDRHARDVLKVQPARGECKSILKEPQVLEIFSRGKIENHRLLASEFKVCRQTISDISRGSRWAWLTKPAATIQSA